TFAPFGDVVRNNAIHRDSDGADSIAVPAAGRRPSYGDNDGMTVFNDTTNKTLSSTVIDLERDLAKTRLDETLVTVRKTKTGKLAPPTQRRPIPDARWCCGQVFTDDAALNVHRASPAYKRLACPHCGKSYSHIRYVADHIAQKHVSNGQVLKAIQGYDIIIGG
ncbi:hypothetical protein AAVH_42503, partial [Aphelenchoides avenae]